MKPEQFPDDIGARISSLRPPGRWSTAAWNAALNSPLPNSFYTCPRCRALFMLEDIKTPWSLAERPGAFGGGCSTTAACSPSWPALSGIFRYYVTHRSGNSAGGHHLPGGRPHSPGGLTPDLKN